MTFKALFKQTFRETKGGNALSRLLCLIALYLLQSSKTQPKGIKLLQKMLDFKQSIAYFYLAKVNFYHANLSKALEQIELFIKIYPKNVDAIYLKAQILDLLNQKSQAFSLLESTLKSSPRVKTWLILSSLVQDEDDLQEVMKIYETHKNTHLNFTKHSFEVLNALFQAAKRIKNYALAKTLLQENIFSSLKNDKNDTPKLTSKKAMRDVDAKEALQDLQDLLQDYELSIFLVSGTFLGCVREKDFLKHDYDIDVGVFSEAVSVLKLREIIYHSKMFIFSDFHIDDAYEVRARHMNGVSIDIFVHFRQDEKIYHYGFCFARWFNTPFELIKYDFLGREYLGAKNYDLYLKENYGANYLTPVADFDSVLMTPNIEILNEQGFIIYLYALLLSQFSKAHRALILELLSKHKEQEFVGKYLTKSKAIQ